MPYFQSLPPAEVRALGRRGATRIVTQGDRVFTEGGPCHGLFVIIEGAVDVRQTSGAGREQSLHTEGAGATLGEVPLFDGGGYLASAVASVPTRLLVLPRVAFPELCRRRLAVALALLETLAQRVRRFPALAAALAFREVTERVARHLEATARAEGRPAMAGTTLELTLTHLIDMNEVVLRAEVKTSPVPGGLTVDVTGAGRTELAIQAMVVPHAAELDQMPGLAAKTEPIPGGVRLTVTARDAEDAKAVARVRGLGFVGLLTLGAHHQPHHLAMARGDAMPGHGH